jgi:hypothetical protein
VPLVSPLVDSLSNCALLSVQYCWTAGTRSESSEQVFGNFGRVGSGMWNLHCEYVIMWFVNANRYFAFRETRLQCLFAYSYLATYFTLNTLAASVLFAVKRVSTIGLRLRSAEVQNSKLRTKVYNYVASVRPALSKSFHIRFSVFNFDFSVFFCLNSAIMKSLVVEYSSLDFLTISECNSRLSCAPCAASSKNGVSLKFFFF